MEILSLKQMHIRGSYTVAGWRCTEDERLVAGIKGTNRKGFILCVQHEKVRYRQVSADSKI